jgi:hypothetical protein
MTLAISLNLMLAVLLTLTRGQSMLEEYCGLVLYNSTSVGLFDFGNDEIVSLEDLMENVTANSMTQNEDTFYTISEENIIYEFNFCLNETQGNTNSSTNSNTTESHNFVIEHALNGTVSNYSGIALAFNTLDGYLYALFDEIININDTISPNITVNTTDNHSSLNVSVNYSVSNPMLYKINVESWKAELVGEIELMVNQTSIELDLETLAFDGEGNLYSWDELIGLLMINLSNATAEIVCDLYNDLGFDNTSVLNSDFSFDYLTFDLNMNDSEMITAYLSNGEFIYELTIEMGEDNTYNCSLVESDFTSDMLDLINGLVLLNQDNCTQYICQSNITSNNDTMSTTQMPTSTQDTSEEPQETTKKPSTTGSAMGVGPSLVNAVLALCFVYATLA